MSKPSSPDGVGAVAEVTRRLPTGAPTPPAGGRSNRDAPNRFVRLPCRPHTPPDQSRKIPPVRLYFPLHTTAMGRSEHTRAPETYTSIRRQGLTLVQHTALPDDPWFKILTNCPTSITADMRYRHPPRQEYQPSAETLLPAPTIPGMPVACQPRTVGLTGGKRDCTTTLTQVGRREVDAHPAGFQGVSSAYQSSPVSLL